MMMDQSEQGHFNEHNIPADVGRFFWFWFSFLLSPAFHAMMHNCISLQLPILLFFQVGQLEEACLVGVIARGR